MAAAGIGKERVRLVRYTPSGMVIFPYLKLHKFVYLHSGGLIGSRRGGGSPTLLLTTTGRRSGEPRTVAIGYLKDGERLVVVASNGGSDRPPSWLLNLQANPVVAIQIGRNKFSARASVASAEERQELWPRRNRNNKGLAPIIHPGALGRYDVLQRHTTRVIPVVLLEAIEPRLMPADSPDALGRYDVLQRHTTRVIPVVLLEAIEPRLMPADSSALSSRGSRRCGPGPS